MRQSRLLVVGGLALGVVGFLWGGMFAGVPYQDATAEQEASFAFHANVAFSLMGLGLGLLSCGLVGRILRAVRGPEAPTDGGAADGSG